MTRYDAACASINAMAHHVAVIAQELMPEMRRIEKLNSTAQIGTAPLTGIDFDRLVIAAKKILQEEIK